MGDRQTAHVGLSNFSVTHDGKVFRGLGGYVPALKGQREAKRALLLYRPTQTFPKFLRKRLKTGRLAGIKVIIRSNLWEAG
jgi:hypothetical protein